MHNKVLTNAGFYLLLLFAFALSVYPPASFILAMAIFLIWMLDVLIFKETRISEMPLFYPLLAFALFMILASILAAIYNHPMPYLYIALLSLFYFIVPGFVVTVDQRRMVIWTFIAGAMLKASLQLIVWWATYANVTLRLRPLQEPTLFMVALAFSFMLAFYAESTVFREKVFMAFVALPLALVIVLSADKSAILLFLATIILVGVLRDPTVFIPCALAVFLLFSGVFGIDYYIQRDISFNDYKTFVTLPFTELKDNGITAPAFYGQAVSFENIPASTSRGNPYLINLLRWVGPPAVLLLLWTLFERAREAYYKRRRALTQQARAYHMISFLTIAAIIIMNLFGSAFEYPSIVLSCWFILGMSET